MAKIKLSSAMRLGMMLVLLEGKALTRRDNAGAIIRPCWESSTPKTHRSFLDGREVCKSMSEATRIALFKRKMIYWNDVRTNTEKARGFRKWKNYGFEFTKQGLHRIKQWPEYGEIMAMKTFNDL